MSELHRITLLEQQVLMLNREVSKLNTDLSTLAKELNTTMVEMSQMIEGIVKVTRMYQAGVEGRLDALEQEEVE